MIRHASISTLFALLLTTGAASAQTPSTTWLVGAGPAYGVGEAFDAYPTGWSVGGAVELPHPTAVVMRIEVAYHRFPLDEGEVRRRTELQDEPDVEIEGGPISAVSGLLSLRGRLSSAESPVRPYVLVGAGYWRRDRDEMTVSGPFGEEVFDREKVDGVIGALAAGADVPVTDVVGLYAETRLMIGWHFTRQLDFQETFAPFRIGLTFTP